MGPPPMMSVSTDLVAAGGPWRSGGGVEEMTRRPGSGRWKADGAVRDREHIRKSLRDDMDFMADDDNLVDDLDDVRVEEYGALVIIIMTSIFLSL